MKEIGNQISSIINNTNQKSKFLSLKAKSRHRRENFALLFCILLFGFCISQAYAQEAKETYAFLSSAQTISIDFKDVSIKDLLKAFSIQAGVNFIASQDVGDRTVTVYLDKVSIKEAMDKLFEANKLDYEFDEKARIILVKEREPKAEMITKIFPLKYARVSTSAIGNEITTHIGETGKGGITAALKGLLSEKGSIVEDPRTNSLIITDVPSRFKVIEKSIEGLDISVPQIMLEVEILDVKKSLMDKIGFNFAGSDFGENPFTVILPGDFVRKGASFFIGDLDDKGKTINDSGVTGSFIFGSTFAGLLDFFHTQSDTKYLARPRILTLNNETAEIKIITQEVIGEEVQYDDQGNISSRTAERTETGISLRITPQVNMVTGEITMFLTPKVIEAATSNFTGYRDPEERGTKSLIKVSDGETIILGGLIRNIKYEVNKKIPILGDIPILGWLFKHREKEKDVERELLVFITPRIIKDSSSLSLQDIDGILSLREQNTSLEEEQRLLRIETVLNSLE